MEGRKEIVKGVAIVNRALTQDVAAIPVLDHHGGAHDGSCKSRCFREGGTFVSKLVLHIKDYSGRGHRWGVVVGASRKEGKH